MSTIEDIKRARKNGLRRVHTRNHNRITSIFSNISLRDIESRIEELARIEEELSLCEKGIAVG